MNLTALFFILLIVVRPRLIAVVGHDAAAIGDGVGVAVGVVGITGVRSAVGVFRGLQFAELVVDALDAVHQRSGGIGRGEAPADH
jgi:hypothetical protein